MEVMKTAVMDIGTNTMLLLIAELEPQTFRINTILDVLRIPRLGKGVDANRNISADSINKAVSLINEYKNLAFGFGVNNIIATGTSFIRDSINKNEFIETIYKDTGIKIEILSGEDEAKWSFWGGIFNYTNSETKPKPMCIIDIGGGSTEISYGIIFGYINKVTISKTKISSFSINIGSVRLYEKFMQNMSPSRMLLSEIENFVGNEISKIKLSEENVILIGVAGTVTTLACIKLGLTKYDANQIEGLEISIEDIFENLSKRTKEELSQLGDFMVGREDIIIPGTIILKSFMRRFKINNIITSTRGLRYGILLREAIK
jgi:exopolyphosphatase/guanosine-5'-triphosphate,3'-diphosphate pyrophosphatase